MSKDNKFARHGWFVVGVCLLNQVFNILLILQRKKWAVNEKGLDGEEKALLSGQVKQEGYGTLDDCTIGAIGRSRSFYGYRPWQVAVASWVFAGFAFILGLGLFVKNDPRRLGGMVEHGTL
jgi:hypothetical protein